MFLSFDGGEGCGKSTQIELTCKWLTEQGYGVVACRDPGSTCLGDSVREILLHRNDLKISCRSEMLLYMAARAQLVDEVIKPALAQNKFVVSDRYLLANIAYQGHARGLNIEELYDIGRCATQGIMPDLTIYLDVPLDIAYKRIDGRPLDRMEKQGYEFHAKVRSGFFAEAYKSDKIAVVEAVGSINEVQAKIQKTIKNFYIKAGIWSF
jgi:dTMP kinase